MRVVLLLALLSGSLSWEGPPRPRGWTAPKGSVIYKRATAVLAPRGQKLTTVFYYEEMQQAGVAVLAPNRRKLASASLDVPHGFAPPTGLLRLKGDAAEQIVVFCPVGAKSSEWRVYDLDHGILRPIFEGSGWSFRVLALGGRIVIAQQTYESSPVDLYLWRPSLSRFAKANSEFPQFYEPEIREKENFIATAQGPWASWFASACEVAAEALLYSRAYVRAAEDCRNASAAIKTRCCSAARSAPPATAFSDRRAAERNIAEVIRAIGAARGRGDTALGLARFPR